MNIRLRDIAHARSGDKGSDANVGVIAYTDRGFEVLKEQLSEERVHAFFSGLGIQGVKRFLLPNLTAVNFILKGALAGGGSRSLRTDAQGKALGEAILEFPLDLDETVVNQCRPQSGGPA